MEISGCIAAGSGERRGRDNGRGRTHCPARQESPPGSAGNRDAEVPRASRNHVREEPVETGAIGKPRSQDSDHARVIAGGARARGGRARDRRTSGSAVERGCHQRRPVSRGRPSAGEDVASDAAPISAQAWPAGGCRGQPETGSSGSRRFRGIVPRRCGPSTLLATKTRGPFAEKCSAKGAGQLQSELKDQSRQSSAKSSRAARIRPACTACIFRHRQTSSAWYKGILEPHAFRISSPAMVTCRADHRRVPRAPPAGGRCRKPITEDLVTQ